MGRRPADRDTPDLFPTATVRDASPKSPTTKVATESESQRFVLPKNLRNAVKHLSDGELDLMHAATLEEMKRRGRTSSAETGLPTRPDSMRKQSPPTEKRRHVDAIDSWSN